jgi:TetR/AcrR family transcriptional regulator, transcriptional repressor for nem operon
MAALSGDAGRQPESVKQVFAEGIEQLLASFERKHGAMSAAARREARARAIDAIAQVVGAVVLSRACPDHSPLADEILQACQSAVLSRLSAPKKR